MVKDYHWDNERLTALTLDALKTVRANAVRLERLELVLLCDAELARRSPVKKRTVASSVATDGKAVGGFHFVCTRDHRGIAKFRWDFLERHMGRRAGTRD